MSYLPMEEWINNNLDEYFEEFTNTFGDELYVIYKQKYFEMFNDFEDFVDNGREIIIDEFFEQLKVFMEKKYVMITEE